MKLKKTQTAFMLTALLGMGGFTVFNSIDPEMTTYTVGKGDHFSFPRIFKLKRNPSTVVWEVVFNEDCDYLILNKNGTVHPDQKDWNKLCGLFFSLFNTRKDSAMMGWRFNPETDEIEMAPYYHVDGGRDMFPTMMRVRRGEPFTVALKVDYEENTYQWKMTKEGFETQHEMPFNHGGGWCGFINFYFGGNQPAPQKVSCQMSLQVTD